jgi:RNA polymerase sigma factor (sigma-70 family)
MTGKPPFETLVSAHGNTVLRVCRAVLGPADADDAWSETFLSALKAYPGLPADANVEAWLVTIAHRKAIDVTRATARHAIPVAETPDPPPGAAGRAPAGAGAGLVADDDLAEALIRLPARQKQAVAYHYLAGLPYADVAAILGGSAEAARRAAADGVATLRRSYPGATPRATTRAAPRAASQAASRTTAPATPPPTAPPPATPPPATRATTRKGEPR